MDNNAKISLFAIIFLTIVIIALIIYSTSVRTSLINPNNCPSTTGNFGVTPLTSGVTINTCGPGLNEPCSFTDVLSLSQAINICNATEFCRAFVYNQNTHVMSIINPEDAVSQDENFDLYVRQNPLVVQN